MILHCTTGVHKRSWQILVACCLLAAPPMKSNANPPPNLLIILADDLGYSDLGCYGGEVETPNLDRLAEGGLRFTQCYNTARCWPTRASLLTGFYAQQVLRDSVPGKTSGSQGIRPKWARLLPEYLRTHGYRNYHSGKWHVDGHPLECGFDRSFEIGGGQNNYFRVDGITEEGKAVSASENFYVTTATADHAIRSLQDHASRYASQPFFSYLAFTSPHFPLHALPEDIDKYRSRYLAGWNEIQRRRGIRLKQLGIYSGEPAAMELDLGPPYAFPDAFEKLGTGEVNRPIPWDELNEQQRSFQANKMAIHAAMIDRMDSEIGRVIDQLKAMKALDQTLILFLSDNGASAEIMVRGDGHDPSAPMGSADSYLCLGPGWSSCSNTPFRRHKTWVHEGGISTPLIVHWPDGQLGARGSFRRWPCHVIDILPTICELAGIKTNELFTDPNAPPLPGQSLVPILAPRQPSFEQSSQPTLPDRALWWLHEGNRALRRGEWKLVAPKNAPWELYRIADDRSESNDLASQFPEVVQSLSSEWDAMTESHQP